MITTKFSIKNNQTIYKFDGHANFAPNGQDIVCAAVSVLYESITNFLIINGYAVEDDEGSIWVSSLNVEAKVAVDILSDSIRQLALQYPKNIEIELEYE